MIEKSYKRVCEFLEKHKNDKYNLCYITVHSDNSWSIKKESLSGNHIVYLFAGSNFDDLDKTIKGSMEFKCTEVNWP